MHIHCLQHVSFEEPGCIARWSDLKGHRLHTTHLYRGDALPELNEVVFLVVMGGPMNVDDEHLHPFLHAEKIFIRACIDAGKTVLGICLGAQLIARAMGSNVFANAEKEIGWLPVTRNMCTAHMVAQLFPESLTCFHWHGDSFDLPEDSVLLASSEGCTNQAFLLGEKVLGLQFHPEATETLVANMLVHEDGAMITGGPYVHTPDEIRNGLVHAATANKLMFSLLDYLETKNN